MRLALTIIVCLLAGDALATAQFGDKLSITGTTVTVYGFTLGKDMAASFATNRPAVWCSANWDGWYAELALRDKNLYLSKLDMDRPGRVWPFNGPSIRKAFGVRVPRDGLHASWFTGVLEEYFGEVRGGAYLRVRKRSFERGILTSTEEGESRWAEVFREADRKRALEEGRRGQPTPGGDSSTRADAGLGTPQQ